MLYIATRSIAQGRSAGIVSVLGVHTGVLIHTIAAVLGISALIEASAVAFNFLGFAGAAFLIFLGIHAFLSKAETLEVKTVEHKKLKKIFVIKILGYRIPKKRSGSVSNRIQKAVQSIVVCLF